MNKIETLTRDEVAKMLGVSATAIPSMIINGTMPIGACYDNGKTTRTVIIKKRWDRWVEGKDLEKR